jgi:spermidine synthase
VSHQTTFDAGQRGAVKVSTGLQCILSLIGFTAVIAQIVLMRELIVVFYGNEISLGIMLAGWLLWTAIGSSVTGRVSARWRDSRKLVAGLETLLAVVFPLTIFAVRASRPVLQSVPGEILGPAPMFLTSFTTLSVFCLLSGGLFAAGSRLCADEARTSTASAASSVYLLEAAGSGLGGILASLVLIRYFTSFEIGACLALLNLLAAAWVGVRALSYRRVLLALLLVSALLIPRAARWMEAKSLALLWHGFSLVESRNSIYGNLALVATSQSRSLFENGLRILTVPDPSAAEEAVHFALLEHTAPRATLLIGGGINGSLAQALQYCSLERIEYVELDPAILGIAERHFAQAWRGVRADPRVLIHPMDGRLFLKTSRAKFDVIIINLPDPFTAQLNRFYTREFFLEAAEKLNPGGVLSFQVTAAENYISQELADLLRCLEKTLRAVFPQVVAIPGETVHFLAANQPGALTLDPSELMTRLRQRRIHTQYFREYYIPFRMSPDRMLDLELQIEPQAATPVNRDFTPIAYYFDVVLWSARFHSHWRGLLESLVGLRFSAVAGALTLGLLALALAVALYERLRIARHRGSGEGASAGSPQDGGVASPQDGGVKPPLCCHNATVGLCVAAMGFTLLGLEVLLLLGFQALYGYVYQQLAILVALFMVGMAVGAWLALKDSRPRGGGLPFDFAEGREPQPNRRRVAPRLWPAGRTGPMIVGGGGYQGQRADQPPTDPLLSQGAESSQALSCEVPREARETMPSEYRRLALLQLLAAAAPLLLYALLVFLASVRSLTALLTTSPMVFPVLALIAGLLGGYQFPLASRIYFAGSEEPRSSEAEVRATRLHRNPGILYGLDLLGACLGAVALSAYLLPVYGFRRTALLMAAVNLGPAALAALAAFEAWFRRTYGASDWSARQRPAR